MAECAGGDAGDAFGTEDEPADEPEDSVPDGEYPEDVVADFVDNCMEGGGSESLCTCTIEALERDIAYDEFRDLVEEYADSGESPPELIDAATECGDDG
jgi:hypothetical protein